MLWSLSWTISMRWFRWGVTTYFLNAVVTTSVCCLCMCVCMHPSRFFQAITFIFTDEFQNNLAQLFSLLSRSVIWKICSDRLMVKVTLEGQWLNCPKYSFSMPLLIHLCSDFKIIWQSCSPWYMNQLFR